MLKNVLADLHDKRREGRRLSTLIVEGLATHTEIDAPGPDTWLVAAQVPTLCPRALVMSYRLGLRMAKDDDATGRWNMDRGTALHRVVQEAWLGPMGVILGGWKCPACAKLHGGTNEWGITSQTAVPMPKACDGCGHKARKQEPFRFVEPSSADQTLRVRGRVDGLLRLPGHGFEVLEIKTTGRLDKIREAPRPDHVIQLHWYLDSERLQSGRLLYLDPGAKNIETCMREHLVAFDAKLMFREKEKIRVLREALSEKSRPVPKCPYGGKGQYGECSCVEMAVLWARSRR